MYQHIKVPEGGQKITVNADYSLNVPDQPILPYIEGDGTGPDIWRATVRVLDAAVAKVNEALKVQPIEKGQQYDALFAVVCWASFEFVVSE